MIGVNAVCKLTFDCRWWGNQHHGNSSICHTGLNLYISAVAIFVAVQLLTIYIAMKFVEETYKGYYSLGDHDDDDDWVPPEKIGNDGKYRNSSTQDHSGPPRMQVGLDSKPESSL